MDPADYYDDETRSGEPMEGAEGAGPEVDLAFVMEVDGGPKSCVCPAEKVDPPDQTKRAPKAGERRLSDVWMEEDVLYIPQTEPVVRRGTRGRAPQGSHSLDSLNSFKSAEL